MAYDEAVAKRLRSTLRLHKGVTEKKMFGGLAFMLGGHMCCGVNGDHLMLRLGEEGTAEALKEKHVRPMDFTGKPIKSMIFLDRPGFASDANLKTWVDRAVAFAKTLPAK